MFSKLKLIIRLNFVLFLLLFSKSAFAQYDVVVIGAGPAGLTAALAAHKEGAKVLVLEKRLYSDWGQRQNIIAIDSDIKQVVSKLGVSDFPLSPLRRYRTYNGLNGQGENIINNNPVSFGIIKNAINRDFGGTVKLGEIEQHLLNKALQLGVEVRFESSFESIDTYSSDIRTEIKLTSGQKIATRFVVDASGAKSQVLAQFNVNRVTAAGLKAKDIMAAVAHYKLTTNQYDGEYRLMMNSVPNHPFYNLALIRGDEATVYLSPTKGELPLDIESAMEQARKNLKINGIQISEVQKFEVNVDAPTQFILGRNKSILVLGDAAHKADPLTGAGVSMAIRDCIFLQNFLKVALKTNNESNLSHARRIYESLLSRQIGKLAQYSNRITGLKSTLSTGAGRFLISLGIGLVSLLPGTQAQSSSTSSLMRPVLVNEKVHKSSSKKLSCNILLNAG